MTLPSCRLSRLATPRASASWRRRAFCRPCRTSSTQSIPRPRSFAGQRPCKCQSATQLQHQCRCPTSTSSIRTSPGAGLPVPPPNQRRAHALCGAIHRCAAIHCGLRRQTWLCAQSRPRLCRRRRSQGKGCPRVPRSSHRDEVVRRSREKIGASIRWPTTLLPSTWVLVPQCGGRRHPLDRHLLVFAASALLRRAL